MDEASALDESEDGEGSDEPSTAAPVEDQSVHSFEGHTGEKPFRLDNVALVSVLCRPAHGFCLTASMVGLHTDTLAASDAGAVLSVAWSPLHPDLVATGGQDDKAFIWWVRTKAATFFASGLATGRARVTGRLLLCAQRWARTPSSRARQRTS
jgi:WD40 repeat protein